MKNLLMMLRKQDGRLSIARVATVIAFICWLLSWAYTLLLGKTYAHFDTVTIAVLTLFFVVLCGKVVDNRIISIKGDEK